MAKNEERISYISPELGILELYAPDAISSSGGQDNDGDTSSEGEWVPRTIRC